MLSQLLSPRLVEALGWTLLHSLWQGAAFALLLGLVLVALRSYSAQARYTISVGLLAGFFLTAATTFYVQYEGAASPTPSPAFAKTQDASAPSPFPNEAVPTSAEPPASVPPATHQPENPQTQQPQLQQPLTRLRDYYQRHLPLLVTVWLLGVLVLQLRWLGQLAFVQRLRHHGTQALPEAWVARAAVLEQKLRLRKTVAYKTSRRVASPMVIGWLKPVVLLPQSLLTQLTDTELYAVLAHELAHVRRDDFAVNLAQTLLTNVFFFHPGAWWMSARVDEEREHCCDDLAVEATGAALPYARTLVQVSSLSGGRPGGPAISRSQDAHTPALAQALTGKRNARQGAGGFSARVRRLFTSQAGVGTFREGFATAVILCGALALSMAATSQSGPTPADATLADVDPGPDVVPATADTLGDPDEVDLDVLVDFEDERALDSLKALGLFPPSPGEPTVPGDFLGPTVPAMPPTISPAPPAEAFAALFEAIDEGDVAAVRMLLAEHPHLGHTQVSREGYSPLLLAAFKGESEIAELLTRSITEEALAQAHAGRPEEHAGHVGAHARQMEVQTELTLERNLEHAKRNREHAERDRRHAERNRRSAARDGSRTDDGEHGNPEIQYDENGESLGYSPQPGWTALIEAADEGELATVRRLVEAGAPLNTNTQPGGIDALTIAASEGHADVVEYLIEAGARLNGSGGGLPPLHSAAEEGQLGVLQMLLEAGASIDLRDYSGRTALMYAADEGHAAVLGWLLSQGADAVLPDANGRTALDYAAAEGHDALVLALTAFTSNGDTPAGQDAIGRALLAAAREGHADVVSQLLSAGANVNAADKYGNTALMAAAGERQPETVRVLLAAGADVELANAHGATALHAAARERAYACIRLLVTADADLEARADINTTTRRLGPRPVLLAYRGATPLVVALEEDDDEAVRQLLALGAEPNVTYRKARATFLTDAPTGDQNALATALLQGDDLTGRLTVDYVEPRWTPLHEAAERGRVDALRALIQAGADVSRANDAGPSLLTVAERYGNPEAVAFINGLK